MPKDPIKNRGASRQNATTGGTGSTATARKDPASPRPSRRRSSVASVGKSLTKDRGDYLDRKAEKVLAAAGRALPLAESRRVFDRRAISDWAAALDNPEERGLGVRCPVNQNVYAPYGSATIRTAGESLYTVASGSALQIFLMAKAQPFFSDELDGDSYHSYLQNVGAAATAHHMGPIPTRGVTPCAPGLVWNYVPAYWNEFKGLSNIAACSALMYATPIPYDIDTSIGGHTKWELVSGALTCLNDTSLASRGGEFFTVRLTRPLNQGLGDFQALSYEPSYKMHGSDGAREVFHPAQGDMAFNHSAAGNFSTNVWGTTGTLVLFNNTTAVTQFIRVAHIENWEIDGMSMRAITSPLVHDERDSALARTAITVASSTGSHVAVALKALATRGAVEAHSFLTGAARSAVKMGSTLIPRLLNAIAVE